MACSDGGDGGEGGDEGDCLPSSSSDFARDAHVQYLLAMLGELPAPYEGQESNRLSLAYFAVSGLDILDALNQVSASEIIDWVYGLQVLPLSASDTQSSAALFGFRGSPYRGAQFSPKGAPPSVHDGGHLAMTYSALAVLKILGDDLSRVCQPAVLASLRLLQQEDGSFCPVHTGGEKDMRFLFCAAAICAMLDDWSGMDLRRAVSYILSSQSYEDGFGLSPGLEAHGGATYCAIATLVLARSSHDGNSTCLPSDVFSQDLIGWCLQRQRDVGGFQGRINKDADACYAFWLGGSLEMLGAGSLIDKAALRTYLLSCQSKWGGFSKWPREWPDLLHSYYAICGFSLLREPGLNSICCELGMSTRASLGIRFY